MCSHESYHVVAKKFHRPVGLAYHPLHTRPLKLSRNQLANQRLKSTKTQRHRNHQCRNNTTKTGWHIKTTSKLPKVNHFCRWSGVGKQPVTLQFQLLKHNCTKAPRTVSQMIQTHKFVMRNICLNRSITTVKTISTNGLHE